MAGRVTYSYYHVFSSVYDPRVRLLSDATAQCLLEVCLRSVEVASLSLDPFSHLIVLNQNLHLTYIRAL
jgi:hypothetical protein